MHNSIIQYLYQILFRGTLKEKGGSMITVKKDTTIAGLSELRNKSEKIIEQLKRHDVILEKHNKPIAVMVNYSKHLHEEELLDFAEEYILGCLAQRRDQESRPRDFIDIEKW